MERIFFASSHKENDLIAFQETLEATKDGLIEKDTDSHIINENHPIYIQMQSLMTARENELKILAASLIHLMNQELQFPYARFQIEFQNLSHTYLMANVKHKQMIKEALENLYHQYEDIPINQFLAFIKTLNLEQLIQQESTNFSFIDENCKQNIELLITYIENSKSLTELDNFIHIASTWLNFDYIKDAEELVRYQNILRNQLLKQLEKYLLSRTKHFLVRSDDKEILQHVLSYERLVRLEEKDFFLQEFEESLTHQHSKEKLEE